nr:PREDICTED: neuroligin-4, Y-linked-like [Bemisia tabaci]
MPKGRLDYLKRILPHLQNQSEDCLYLNIYAPAQGSGDPTSKYPVLVFIHGESYSWNSGNPYDGTVLSSYGKLVVVTVNYRLGVLGFLNANPDPGLRAPANYGLMDQLAALHWIQENIAVFGGDPTNVTLLGHGTGAACVNFLLTSNAVPDGVLFHRAILMSGSSLSPWALVRDPSRWSREIAEQAGCNPQLPHTLLLKCLRDKPLANLTAAHLKDVPPFTATFGPSVDGVIIDTGLNQISKQDSSHQQLEYNLGSGPGRPEEVRQEKEDALIAGGYAHVVLNDPIMRKNMISKLSRYDLLIGVTRAEAFFTFNADDIQYGIEADRRSKILTSFVKNTYRYHLSEILATIVNEYTDWERPVQHPVNIRDETLEALSDAQVVAPVVNTADLHSIARRNSYLYVFDYQTKYGDYQQRQGCIFGEDLPYVFGAPLVSGGAGLIHFPRNFTKAEVALAETTMNYWSNFIRTGNPNEMQETDTSRAERNRFKNIEWTAYEAVHKKYLSLDTKPKLKNHFRAHRLSFWLNLIPDLHKPGSDDVPRSHHQLDADKGISTTAPSTPRSSWNDTLLANKSGVLGTLYNNSLSLGSNAHPIVVVAPSSSERGASDGRGSLELGSSAAPQEDGLAAYSAALNITIVIGCSLLILNVLIFAVVYYQKDKTRHHHHHHHNGHHEPGMCNNDSNSSFNSSTPNNSYSATIKKRQENGGPITNLCSAGGATELLQIIDNRSNIQVPSILKKPSPSQLLVLEPPYSQHTLPYRHHGAHAKQMAEFSCSTLPRAPLPAKVPKVPDPNPGGGGCGPPAESQPLLVDRSKHSNKIDELRV